MQDRVERGAVGAHPGLDGRVPPDLGAAAVLMAAGRVDVHAADDVPGAGAEDGVGEPAALGEVSRGQLPSGNPGVARMWSMLAVQAA